MGITVSAPSPGCKGSGEVLSADRPKLGFVAVLFQDHAVIVGCRVVIDFAELEVGHHGVRGLSRDPCSATAFVDDFGEG